MQVIIDLVKPVFNTIDLSEERQCRLRKTVVTRQHNCRTHFFLTGIRPCGRSQMDQNLALTTPIPFHPGITAVVDGIATTGRKQHSGDPGECNLIDSVFLDMLEFVARIKDRLVRRCCIKTGRLQWWQLKG